jgi:hypothetical protein
MIEEVVSNTALDVDSRVSCSSFLEYVPYESCLSNEQQENIRHGLEKWLLSNNMVSPGELNEMRKRKPALTGSEWGVIRNTPGDYWLILFAKRMTPQQQSRFLKFEFANDQDFFHYNKMQAAWIGEAMRFFYETNGRLPNTEEESSIINSLGGEFRVFYNLRTRALGESVNYPNADEMIAFKHKVASKNYSELTFIPG